MKIGFSNFLVQRVESCGFRLLLCLLLHSSLLDAWGDQHWTTNGTHKGFVERAVPSGDTSGLDRTSIKGGRDYLGRYRIGYALGSLLGEPVHDFVFTWDWRDADLVVAEVQGRTVTTRDLSKYPELSKRFFTLKPYAITLEMTAEFFDPAEHRFSVGVKTVQPDMIDKAGVTDPLHVPGSPEWADFFSDNAPDNASREGLASRHKKLFKDAASVRLTQPKITAIEWSETMLRLIADEFVRREAEKASASKPVAKPPDGLNPMERAALAERKLNPLEMASQGIRTKPENPLEKSVRLESEANARQAAIRQEADRQAELARQAQWAEDQRRQAQEERQSQYAADMARAERDAEERADNAAYQRAVRAQSRDKRLRESRSSPALTFSAPASSGSSGGLQLTVEHSETKPRGVALCPTCYGRRKCVNCEGRGYFEKVEVHYKKLPPGATAISQDDPGTKQTVRKTCGACDGSGKCHDCGGTGIERRSEHRPP